MTIIKTPSSPQNPLKWIKNLFHLCKAVFLLLIVLLKQDKAGPEHKVQDNLGHPKLLQPLFRCYKSKSHQMVEIDKKKKELCTSRKKTINESDLKPEGADIPLGIACLLLHLLKLHCLRAHSAQFCTIFNFSSIARSF